MYIYMYIYIYTYIYTYTYTHTHIYIYKSALCSMYDKDFSLCSRRTVAPK